jgi:hypothetical protein
MIRSTRADGAMLKMPVARYFFFVGAALLALLFVVDAYLPNPPTATDAVTAAADLPMIRIHTDRKWPERIVFDTTIPAASSTQMAAAAPLQAAAKVAQAPTSNTDVSAKVREAFAQLQPPDSPQVQPSASKTPLPAPAPQRKHKMVKRQPAAQMVLVAQQQQPRPFGFFFQQ